MFGCTREADCVGCSWGHLAWGLLLNELQAPASRLWFLPGLKLWARHWRVAGVYSWCELPTGSLSWVLQVTGAGTALLAVVTCQHGGTELRQREGEGELLCSSLAAVAPSLVLGTGCSPQGRADSGSAVLSSALAVWTAPSGQLQPHAVHATCNLSPAPAIPPRPASSPCCH